MKKALLILAKEGFQDQEEAGTHDALEKAGFTVQIASTEAGMCTGKFGGMLEAHLDLAGVNAEEYDCIAFIGGPGAAALADNAEAQRIAREAVAADLPLGAICIAPTILAKAGVLQGKQATVWDSEGRQKELLKEHGAEYTGQPVTVDGLIVTGNGPEAAAEFGQQLAKIAQATNRNFRRKNA